MVDFPGFDVLNDDIRSAEWLEAYFHPAGLRCPKCGAGPEKARSFRKNAATNGLVVYRCECDMTYNLYSGTSLERKYLRPSQAVGLLVGLWERKPIGALAEEIGLSLRTIYYLRHAVRDCVPVGGEQDTVWASKG
jgi:transposase-like protein